MFAGAHKPWKIICIDCSMLEGLSVKNQKKNYPVILPPAGTVKQSNLQYNVPVCKWWGIS